MSDLLFDEKKDEITAGFFNKDAFAEKKKLLLVLKTGIAGMHYYVNYSTDEGKKLLEKLKPGTELYLYRDTENEYDEWAIYVFTTENEKIGYISRYKNETVARLMDYGKKFIAKVDEPASRVEKVRSAVTEDFRVPFSVYMED